MLKKKEERTISPLATSVAPSPYAEPSHSGSPKHKIAHANHTSHSNSPSNHHSSPSNHVNSQQPNRAHQLNGKRSRADCNIDARPNSPNNLNASTITNNIRPNSPNPASSAASAGRATSPNPGTSFSLNALSAALPHASSSKKETGRTPVPGTWANSWETPASVSSPYDAMPATQSNPLYQPRPFADVVLTDSHPTRRFPMEKRKDPYHVSWQQICISFPLDN